MSENCKKGNCDCETNQEYFNSHGLPEKLALFVESEGQIAIGEWIAETAFRVLMVSRLQYGEYSYAVAVDLVRAFYDDKIQRCYIAQVDSRITTGRQVQSFEDFCKLTMIKNLIKDRDLAIKSAGE